MTVVPTNAISDLASFTSIIQSEINSNQSTWYRGCGSYSHKLQPTLYQHPSINTIEGLMEKESEIIDRFKERCIPHLDRQLVGDWEYLFLMQHHGVLTRLLDWSENPFFALYFAIESAPYKLTGGSPKYSESAAFWVLDPTQWNRRALQYVSFDQSILSASDDRVRGYCPRPDLSLMGNEPLAIYGAHNSPRIVAQRGVFTIFGKSLKPMEGIPGNGPFPSDVVKKFEIPKEAIPDLRWELDAIGITAATVFPDLDGLAKELKRNLAYEV